MEIETFINNNDTGSNETGAAGDAGADTAGGGTAGAGGAGGGAHPLLLAEAWYRVALVYRHHEHKSTKILYAAHRSVAVHTQAIYHCGWSSGPIVDRLLVRCV